MPSNGSKSPASWMACHLKAPNADLSAPRWRGRHSGIGLTVRGVDNPASVTDGLAEQLRMVALRPAAPGSWLSPFGAPIGWLRRRRLTRGSQAPAEAVHNVHQAKAYGDGPTSLGEAADVG